MTVSRTPTAETRSLRAVGEHLQTWRKLDGIAQALAAERAGISVATLRAIEQGESVSTENLLRVTRVLGVMDDLAAALDPMNTDRGRARRREAPAAVRIRRGR
ncbi:helix-turn-helix domain-containing protein [Cellulosimicrobium sp. KWT-B]|uniref:helix-turn-helix domain-containing protein n=1 Tax=Cellulosimicrobium sp. KWT-B TaxID=1981152 RepID=UPI000A327D58|nr:helix-turn-helix transcriptional regulator [Cellulosimicrobium sp. KWT-B]